MKTELFSLFARRSFDTSFAAAWLLWCLVVFVLAIPVKAHEHLITNSQTLVGPDGQEIWPNRTIPVCFRYNHQATRVTPTQAIPLRNLVPQALAETWERSADIDFTGFGSCPNSIAGYTGIYVNVHVAGSGASAGFRQGVKGRVSLGIDADRYAIVHEFGHILGFAHSQLRNDTPTWCIDGAGGTFDEWYLDDELTKWDPRSVMNYCADRPLRQGGLSPLDVRGVQSRYGVNPAQRLGANERGDLFGSALALGDFTGDGLPDLAVGAPGEDLGSESDAGAVFMFSGNEIGTLQHLSALTQTGLGANEAGDRFGHRVVAANLDGRGADELVVSAPMERPGSSTTDNGALFIFNAVDGSVEPLVLTTYQEAYFRNLGFHGLAAGDVDGDGSDEIVTSVKFSNEPGLMIIGLNSLTSPTHVKGEIKLGEDIGGLVVADLLGDGAEEIVVGLPDAPIRNGVRGGRVEIYSRESDGKYSRAMVFHQSHAEPSEDEDHFGRTIAVGDFNGDGSKDIAIGSPGEAVGTTVRAGLVSIYRKSGSSFFLSGHFSQTDLGLGRAETGDAFGSTLHTGDFDGDGYDDLVVTSPGEVSAGSSSTHRPGYASVFYGGPDMLKAGRGHWLSQRPIGVEKNNDKFGRTMAAVDLDGDGRTELVVSAPSVAAGASGSGRAGRVYVFRTPPRYLENWYALDQRDLQ